MGQVAATVSIMPDTVDTVIWAPDDGWRYHPKHVEQFADINKLYIVASCWIIIDTYLRTIDSSSHQSYINWTPQNEVFENLNLPRLLRKFTHFMEPAASLRFSKQPATCPYPESDTTTLHHSIIFPYDLFNIIILSTPRFSMQFPSFRLPTQYQDAFIFSTYPPSTTSI